MIAKLDKESVILVHKKKHYKIFNGQDISKLPKGLQKSMKNSKLTEEVKDGNKIRK